MEKEHFHRLFVFSNFGSSSLNKSFGLSMVTWTEIETCPVALGLRVTHLTLSSRSWPFGQDGCALHGFQGMISVLASISFMAAIAWDRYHQYCTSEYNALAKYLHLDAVNGITLPSHYVTLQLASAPARSKTNSQWWLKAMHPLLWLWGLL